MSISCLSKNLLNTFLLVQESIQRRTACKNLMVPRFTHIMFAELLSQTLAKCQTSAQTSKKYSFNSQAAFDAVKIKFLTAFINKTNPNFKKHGELNIFYQVHIFLIHSQINYLQT